MENRVPPNNLEAEQSVLGGILLEQDSIDEITELISEDDFYKPANRKIFACMKELNKTGQPIDIVTATNYLMKTNELDFVGGPGYLAELIDNTATTANIVSHAKIINDKSLIRQLIAKNNEIISKAYKQDFEDVQSFLDFSESEIYSLSENETSNGLTDSSELVKSSIKLLEDLYASQDDLTGVPSGYDELDNMTAGFQKGELTIIAARPSMGKTAFSLNLCLHAALTKGTKIAYFSVEMAKEQVMTRLLSIVAKIPLGNLRVGNIDDKAWPRLISAAAKLSEASIYIDDTSGISPFEIRSKSRRLKSKVGLDLIIVDYLQLMSLKQRVESREREVSEISKTLKAIAKELKVPVLALAQLNRGVEGRTDRRPMLSDLRESGSIEQDADIIMMLYREDYYDRDNPEIKGIAEVIVGKQRNGPTGKAKLRWIPEFGVFKNLEEERIGPNPPTPYQPPPGPAPKGSGKFVSSPMGMGSAPSANSGPRPGSPGFKPKNFAPGS